MVLPTTLPFSSTDMVQRPEPLAETQQAARGAITTVREVSVMVVRRALLPGWEAIAIQLANRKLAATWIAETSPTVAEELSPAEFVLAPNTMSAVEILRIM